MGVDLGDIVEEEVVLAVEVVEKAKFKGVLDGELWCCGFALLKGHVVSL